MNSTENMYNILEQIVHSYQPMCSLVRKLCHNLQFKFEAQCATNWWHAFVCGWQICQRVIITQDVSSVQVKILSHTSTEKDNFKEFRFRFVGEPTHWSLRRSIGEAGIGIILWLQHQPCGEVDIILHPIDYELSNATWIIKTNRIVASHWVGPRRPCIITWPTWT